MRSSTVFRLVVPIRTWNKRVLKEMAGGICIPPAITKVGLSGRFNRFRRANKRQQVVVCFAGLGTSSKDRSVVTFDALTPTLIRCSSFFPVVERTMNKRVLFGRLDQDAGVTARRRRPWNNKEQSEIMADSLRVPIRSKDATCRRQLITLQRTSGNSSHR